jgi:PAS domain-containing protein
VTTHEDVTDRISVQRERDRNRDLLNLIVENVPVTIFVKNASDRRFILVNRACENVWGLSRSEILGRTASDIFPQAAADEINEGDERRTHAAALGVLPPSAVAAEDHGFGRSHRENGTAANARAGREHQIERAA